MKTNQLIMFAFTALVLFGCNDLKKENLALRAKLDSLTRVNDSTKQFTPLIYDKPNPYEKFVKKSGYLCSLLELLDTLELTQVNEKCGEWGGDTEKIKIFSVHNLKTDSIKLFAYYMKDEFSCEDLMNYATKNPKRYKTENRELNNNDALIAQQCITDLLAYKLKKPNVYGNSGIINTVVLSEPNGFRGKPIQKIYIEDYPSFEWRRFHMLKEKINK